MVAMRVTKKHVYSNSIYLHVLVEVELCSMVASDSINVYSSLGSPVTGLTPGLTACKCTPVVLECCSGIETTLSMRSDNDGSLSKDKGAVQRALALLTYHLCTISHTYPNRISTCDCISFVIQEELYVQYESTVIVKLIFKFQ